MSRPIGHDQSLQCQVSPSSEKRNLISALVSTGHQAVLEFPPTPPQAPLSKEVPRKLSPGPSMYLK